MKIEQGILRISMLKLNHWKHKKITQVFENAVNTH